MSSGLSSKQHSGSKNNELMHFYLSKSENDELSVKDVLK